MQLRIDIKRMSDGVCMTRHEEFGYDRETAIYLYAEGNYSCDCNREIFWKLEAGEDETEESPCGNARYRIRLYLDGELAVDEWSEEGGSE